VRYIELHLHRLRGRQIRECCSAVEDLDHLHARFLHPPLHDSGCHPLRDDPSLTRGQLGDRRPVAFARGIHPHRDAMGDCGLHDRLCSDMTQRASIEVGPYGAADERRDDVLTFVG